MASMTRPWRATGYVRRAVVATGVAVAVWSAPVDAAVPKPAPARAPVVETPYASGVEPRPAASTAAPAPAPIDDHANDWKWALFGGGVAALTFGTVGTLWTGITLGEFRHGKGPLHEPVAAAAERSLIDDNPVNDIDPRTVDDLCSDAPGSGGAREEVAPEGLAATPGIRNGAVAIECERVNRRLGLLVLSSITAAAGATAVITSLVLLYRGKSGKRSDRRVRVSPAVSPSMAAVTATMRF